MKNCCCYCRCSRSWRRSPLRCHRSQSLLLPAPSPISSYCVSSFPSIPFYIYISTRVSSFIASCCSCCCCCLKPRKAPSHSLCLSASPSPYSPSLLLLLLPHLLLHIFSGSFGCFECPEWRIHKFRKILTTATLPRTSIYKSKKKRSKLIISTSL